jgi:hypothetical protein
MGDSRLLAIARINFECDIIEVLALKFMPEVIQFGRCRHLPVELLQIIFQYYLCSDTDLPEIFLFVFHRWHDTAISFPTLWSDIDPTPLRINPKWQVQFIQARYLHSRPLLLYLDLRLDLALDSIVDTPTLPVSMSALHDSGGLRATTSRSWNA